MKWPGGATLTIELAPDAGEDARAYWIDCRHGSTVGLVARSRTLRPAVSAAALVAALLEQHDNDYGCRCTERLQRVYGDALPAQLTRLDDPSDEEE